MCRYDLWIRTIGLLAIVSIAIFAYPRCASHLRRLMNDGEKKHGFFDLDWGMETTEPPVLQPEASAAAEEEKGTPARTESDSNSPKSATTVQCEWTQEVEDALTRNFLNHFEIDGEVVNNTVLSEYVPIYMFGDMVENKMKSQFLKKGASVAEFMDASSRWVNEQLYAFWGENLNFACPSRTCKKIHYEVSKTKDNDNVIVTIHVTNPVCPEAKDKATSQLPDVQLVHKES